MKKLIRWIHKLPKYHIDVWWNQTCYVSDKKYPIIFDSEKRYIECKIGTKVVMGKTKSGKDIYYEVVKRWRTGGSDWLSDSDAFTCNLKFSHIK